MKAFHCIAAALLTLGLIGGAMAEEKGEGTKAGFSHVVVFHLKKDAPAGTADQMIADAHTLLAKVPTVREVRAGKPAANATEIAKKDYQVGLVVLFDNVEGLKTYIDHPLHKQYVEKYQKYWEPDQVAVYDFEDVKK